MKLLDLRASSLLVVFLLGTLPAAPQLAVFGRSGDPLAVFGDENSYYTIV